MTDDPLFKDYRRVKGAAWTGRGRKRNASHLGGPFELVAEVARLTRGRAALLVALYVCRRDAVVTDSEEITLDGAELAELGLSGRAARRALDSLEAVGLITQRRRGSGRRTAVTLKWPRAAE